MWFMDTSFRTHRLSYPLYLVSIRKWQEKVAKFFFLFCPKFLSHLQQAHRIHQPILKLGEQIFIDFDQSE